MSTAKSMLHGNSSISDVDGSASRYKTSSSAMAVVKRVTKEHYSSNRQIGDQDTERISSNDEDSILAIGNINKGKGSAQRFRSMIDRSLGKTGAKDIHNMSLEDRILHGIYKA